MGIDWGGVGQAFAQQLIERLLGVLSAALGQAISTGIDLLLGSAWNGHRYAGMLTSTVNFEGGGDFTSSAVIAHFLPYTTAAADAGLVLVATWGCYHLMFAHSVRGLYSLHVLLPRLLLGIVLIHASSLCIQQAVDFTNSLSKTVVGAEQPIAGQALFDDFGNNPAPKALTLAALGFGYIVLALTYAVRYALLVLLAITAPVAALLFILPDTHHWARKWGSLFVSALIMQPAQLLILAVGLEFENVSSLLPFHHVFALASVWLCFKVPGALHDTSTVASHAMSQAKHLATTAIHHPARVAHVAALAEEPQ